MRTLYAICIAGIAGTMPATAAEIVAAPVPVVGAPASVRGTVTRAPVVVAPARLVTKDRIVAVRVPAIPGTGPAEVVLLPPRRYLTTYMAKYPFGVLREDYTPLGAPGVSKRDYYGRPTRYAVLHSSPRRAFKKTRVVLRTRY